MKPYKVYVLTDLQGCVIDINSDAFLSSMEGWQQIDEGSGDKYRHAQGNYLPMPLYSPTGSPNWKLEGGVLVLRTEEEKAADDMVSAPSGNGTEELSTLKQQVAEIHGQIAELNQALDMLLLGVTEDE